MVVLHQFTVEHDYKVFCCCALVYYWLNVEHFKVGNKDEPMMSHNDELVFNAVL